MTISVITPTADQPTGIRLLEKYMAAQTLQPDQWIVADDGEAPASLSMGQTHLVAPRTHEGAKSLASNILRALESVTGDIVIVWEHDDAYLPTHIETCLKQLGSYEATGSKWQRYYNVSNRHWRTMPNIGSALCNTAFRKTLIPKMREAAQWAFDNDKIGLDRRFWDSLPPERVNLHDINTMIGIKGLPGRKGLGMGHKPPDANWTHDPDLSTLKEWCPDWANYQEFGQ